MAVEKINGFSAPYRSLTFRKIADEQAMRNGLLSMSGALTKAGSILTVPAFSAIQQGLIIRSTTERLLTIPAALVAPYFLTVAAATPSNLDDLSFQFAKSPRDVAANEVIIGLYDGAEWKSPDLISIDGLVKARETQNVASGQVGPLSGLRSSISLGTLTVIAGDIIDTQGHLSSNLLDRSFTEIPQDPDYERIDRVVWRRSDDSVNRVGHVEYLLGSTYGSSLTLYDTSLTGSTVPHKTVKALSGSDNSANLFVAEGYGVTWDIKFAKYASDRTTVVTALTTVASATSEDFSVAQDSSGNFYIAFCSGNDIKIQKINSLGVLVGASYVASSSSNPNTEPRIAIDYQDKIYIFFRTLVNPLNNQHYLTTRNTSGSLITSPVRIQNDANNYGQGDIFVTDDLLVYLAYTSLTLNQVRYEIRDDIGAVVQAPITISGATDAGSHGILNGGASQPKVLVSDNKEPFITFLQDKGSSQKGLSLYKNGTATLTDIFDPAENFLTYGVALDTCLNDLHLILSRSANTDYVKHGKSTIPLYSSASSYVALTKDAYGSILHARSTALATTYTDYGTPQPVAHIGPVTVIGTLSAVTLASNECLIASTVPTFLVGERATFAGSINGNNGSRIIAQKTAVSLDAINDYYLVSMETAFVATESPTFVVTSQFATPDGNESRFIKSVSAYNKEEAYLQTALDTDVLLARINNQKILNYIPGDLVNSDQFAIHGGTLIDWERTAAGELTITGPFSVYDLVEQQTYIVQNGGYVMSEGKALYIPVDKATFSVTPLVCDLEDLPLGERILVLGFIKDGAFNSVFMAKGGVGRLDSDEQELLGGEFSENVRSRLGVISETTYSPYTSTSVIDTNDSYADALSKLDAALIGVMTVNPDEEYAIVPAGGATIFQATTLTWDATVGAVDIAVFVNGVRQTQDRAGGTDNPFRKLSSTRIEFSYTLPELAKVLVRLERAGGGGGGGGSALVVKDEGVTKDSACAAMDFVGAGVTVTQISPTKVQVTIPGSGAGVENITKLVKNGTLFTIPANSACAWADDGTITLADANVVTESDFAGIAISSIAAGAYGLVVKSGNAPGVLAGLGATPGQEVYLGEIPGTMSLSPPGGYTDVILKLGRAEPASGVASPTAEDLFLEIEVISTP